MISCNRISVCFYCLTLQIVAKDDTYTVNKNEEKAKLTVEIISDEEKYVVNVTLTSPSIREAILSAAEGGK